ncbi:hypothetical protein [Nitrolancea hollandica]|nr:hypothetical protein [Nitrolancea hollandica]
MAIILNGAAAGRSISARLALREILPFPGNLGDAIYLVHAWEGSYYVIADWCLPT